MNTPKAPTSPLSSKDLEQLEKKFDSTEDPIARFFKYNQKIITYIFAAVLIAVLGFRFYDSARNESLQRAAEVFADTRIAFQSLAQQEEAGLKLADLEAANRSFTGTIKTLQDQNYPYDLLARNYQALAEVKSGNLSKADIKSKLVQVDWQKSKNSPNAIWKELLALNLTKILLSDKEQESFALEQIKILSSESNYVRPLALLAWRSFADTKNDSKELKVAEEAIQTFSTSFPEQSDLFK